MNKLFTHKLYPKKQMIEKTLKNYILPFKSGDTNLYGHFSAYAGQTGPYVDTGEGGMGMTQMHQSALNPGPLNRHHNFVTFEGGGQINQDPAANMMAATSSSHSLRQATWSMSAEMHHGPQFI